MADEIGDDEPVPLSVAAKIFFRGHLTKSALRTEAAKGNLETIRIANKDFVTRRAIQQMIEKCTIRSEPTKAGAAIERQARTSAAKEALRFRLQQRKTEAKGRP